MKYNKSEIMKEAWKLRKMSLKWVKALPFAECLKRAWANAKAAQFVNAYIVPLWKWQEVALFGVRSNIVKETEIEKETKKAFRVRGEWIPKSICEYKKVAA